jgi:S1-C subfamily serine protease
MKKWLVAAVFVLATPLSAADWTTVVAAVEPTMVHIAAQMDEDTYGLCTGAYVAPQLVLTAAHCFEGAKELYLLPSKQPVMLFVKDMAADLALLRTSEPGTALPLAEKTPPRGTAIALIGFPWRTPEAVFQAGYVSSTLFNNPKLGPARFIYADVMVIVGDSGAPVVNQAGQLVGVVSAGAGEGTDHIAVLVPVEVVSDFLRQHLPRSE